MAFAFVFPGQGSQSLKMMDNWLDCGIAMEQFALAKEILGNDFLAMLQEEDATSINQTVNTQPLLLTAGYAMYLAWLENGGKVPNIMAGHSLGEWTALVASGVIQFSDALKLVRLRAEAMQDAVKPGDGAMVAVVGLDDETIIKICKKIEDKSGGVVSGVNFNSPGQVVIAGDKASVDAAAIILKENGARKIIPLALSVPSHCSLMKPASIKLAKALQEVEFKIPSIPVLHNYNVSSYEHVEQIKQALVKQLYMPVLWTQTINTIVAKGVSQIVECGPGKVLSGLNKRIDPNLISFSLHQKADFDTAFAEIK